VNRRDVLATIVQLPTYVINGKKKGSQQMGDDDNDFEERFALKVKPDTRIKQIRYLKPEVARKLKAIKRDMKTSIISTDQFNNKKQKQNKEKKHDR
jgi:hypothetical protein